MPDIPTPFYGLTKPEVGGSDDTWGAKNNANFDTIDTVLHALELSSTANAAAIANLMPKAGGDFAGIVNFKAGAGVIAPVGANFNKQIKDLAGAEGTTLEVRGNGTGPAVMMFHRPGAVAVYFGLDTDGGLRYGGFSLTGHAYAIYSELNLDAAKVGEILGYVPANNAALANYALVGHTHSYLPLAGGEVTGSILRDDMGAHLFHVNDAMDSGRVFLTAEGAADPTSAPGDTWITY